MSWREVHFSISYFVRFGIDHGGLVDTRWVQAHLCHQTSVLCFQKFSRLVQLCHFSFLIYRFIWALSTVALFFCNENIHEIIHGFMFGFIQCQTDATWLFIHAQHIMQWLRLPTFFFLSVAMQSNLGYQRSLKRTHVVVHSSTSFTFCALCYPFNEHCTHYNIKSQPNVLNPSCIRYDYTKIRLQNSDRWDSHWTSFGNFSRFCLRAENWN